MTTKIQKIDPKALSALREQIDAALAELGEKTGIKFSAANASYERTGFSATFKLELKLDDPEAEAKAAKATWDANCRYLGDFDTPLRPEDLGTEFGYGGATYKTTGIATKGKGSQKFPILCEIVKAGPRGGKVGEVRMLPETAVATIRAATDAKAKADA